MKFPLKDIELHIEDALVEQAENWLEAGHLFRLEEVDRHLWVLYLGGDSPLEVEVQISPAKVLAYTCECPTFQVQGRCMHIVIAFLQIRAEKARQQAHKKNAEPTVKKLTTSAILKQIDQEALKQFLRQYARENRDFALALKANFAHLVPLANHREKYKQLYEAVLNSIKQPLQKINAKGVGQIEKVINQIHQQATRAIDEQAYTQAFDIIEICLEKTGPLLHAMGQREQVIAPTLIKVLQLLAAMSRIALAPALKSRIWQFSLQMAFYGPYLSRTYAQYLFSIAMYLSDDKEKKQALRQQIEQSLSYDREPVEVKSHLLLCLAYVLPNLSDLSKRLEAYAPDSPSLLLSIEKAIAQKAVGDFSLQQVL
ncbi:MAG: hypothetical protein AAFP19_11795, partial [Bacteroidota bacterium]